MAANQVSMSWRLTPPADRYRERCPANNGDYEQWIRSSASVSAQDVGQSEVSELTYKCALQELAPESRAGFGFQIWIILDVHNVRPPVRMFHAEARHHLNTYWSQRMDYRAELVHASSRWTDQTCYSIAAACCSRSRPARQYSGTLAADGAR